MARDSVHGSSHRSATFETPFSHTQKASAKSLFQEGRPGQHGCAQKPREKTGARKAADSSTALADQAGAQIYRSVGQKQGQEHTPRLRDSNLVRNQVEDRYGFETGEGSKRVIL